MPGPRFSFVAKLIAALLLIVAADQCFYNRIGSWLGALALAWLAILVMLRPALRRGPARIAAIAGAGFALTVVDDPGLLGWALFWTTLSIATLLPRTAGFDDAWRWAIRLAAHAITGPFSPIVDLPRLLRPRPRRGRATLGSVTALLALPIGMSAIFVALFASANPLIAQAFANIRLPSIQKILFWSFVLAIVWPSLRPRAWVTRLATALPDPEITLPGASVPSVLISLALFNAVFAIQNGLDIVFLWSGAALPAGITMTDYVHRGAYPLIVTALLAGIFVLATLKPGSATAASPTIRRLLILWVAQNLVLAASSALRTGDYIAEYMLTPWRIAALAWMALVALGLVLICWRMFAGKSARWLINTNAIAAALVLITCSVIDLNAISAAWNVRHAREAGGRAAPLDLCQLRRMGPPALLSLIDLESRPLEPVFRDRVRAVRQDILDGRDWGAGLISRQADWHSWTWRDARRLADATRRLGAHPAQPLPNRNGRDCDGSIFRPLPPTPLTPAAKP